MVLVLLLIPPACRLNTDAVRAAWSHDKAEHSRLHVNVSVKAEPDWIRLRCSWIMSILSFLSFKSISNMTCHLCPVSHLSSYQLPSWVWCNRSDGPSSRWCWFLLQPCRQQVQSGPEKRRLCTRFSWWCFSSLCCGSLQHRAPPPKPKPGAKQDRGCSSPTQVRITSKRAENKCWEQVLHFWNLQCLSVWGLFTEQVDVIILKVSQIGKKIGS